MSSPPPDRSSAGAFRVEELVAEAEAEVSRRAAGLIRPRPNQSAAPVFTNQPTPKRRDRRGDVTVAALGVTLGLICAMFPWYIFFNPEDFGVRAIPFGGSGDATVSRTPMLSPAAEPDGRALGAGLSTTEGLDPLPTGTTAGQGEGEDKQDRTKEVTEQPFPAPTVTFKVIHIANGRAMVEDDGGIFVVQRGAVLPDRSHVASIEERDGRWVMVTSGGEVYAPGGQD